jgi:predicted amidohydrolase
MALFLRLHPGGQQYRLPKEDEAGEVTQAIAQILGKRGCVVLGYEMPDQPRNTAVVLINGNVIATAELVDVPDEEPET